MQTSPERRSFLKKLGLLAMAPSLKEPLGEAQDLRHVPSRGYDLELEELGEVALKKPAAIEASPFGIGCETLDRQLWEPKEVYPWLTDLPVKWARLQTGWARVEKTKGQYDWDWLDESVDGLVQRGIQPFLSVSYGNPLYVDSARHHPMVSEESVSAWKRYVAALAGRYRDRVEHYEIWNEPNLSGFWGDEPDPETYVRLVEETAPLIRENGPGAQIIGGATSRIPQDYIRRMLDAGLAEHIDVFSFHPYTSVPESYTKHIRALRRLLDQYEPGIDIWQGENGIPSEPGSTGFSGEGPWTENIQAKGMLRRLVTDCKLEVEKSIWFLIIDLHDYPRGSGNVNYKGILRAKPDIRPKVAYRVLQHLGSVVHGNVQPRNAAVHVMDGSEPMTDARTQSIGNGLWDPVPDTSTAVLNTANGLVLAYWLTEPSQDERSPVPVHLAWYDWEGDGLQDPVVVNPFTGKIHEVPSPPRPLGFARDEGQLFDALPMVDYPLLVMERTEVLEA